MNHMILCALMPLMGLVSSAAAPDGLDATSGVRLAKWRGDRQAAVSFTFDDGLIDQYAEVYPTLEKAGIKGTFWLIGRKITNGEKELDSPMMTWDNVREMAAHGHEMSNHGWGHHGWNPAVPERMIADMETNDVVIARETGRKPKTYCYPYNSNTPEAEAAASRGRVGTRTFQAGFGRNMTMETFRRQFEETAAKGDWRVYMTHGIVQGFDSWGDPTAFREMIAWAARQRDRFWIDTFAAVAAYGRERDAFSWREVRRDGAVELHPCSTGLDPELFTEPLTLVVPVRYVRIEQDGRVLTPARTGEEQCVDINPHGGVVVLFEQTVR